MNSALEEQHTHWRDLQRRIAGRFSARARGLLAPEHILLDPDDQQFGSLRPEGSGAVLEAGELSAIIERDGGAEYRMTSGGTTLLTAAPEARAHDVLKIRAGERVYRARFSPFRNTAVAYLNKAEEGREVSRLKGGFAGRRYEAFFDVETDGAFWIPVLLLHHAAALRRSAYRT